MCLISTDVSQILMIFLTGATFIHGYYRYVSQVLNVIILGGTAQNPCPYQTGWSDMYATFNNERVVCCKWEKALIVFTAPGLTSFCIMKISVVISFIFRTPYWNKLHTNLTEKKVR